MVSLLRGLIISLALPGLLQASDWPQWRGPGCQSPYSYRRDWRRQSLAESKPWDKSLDQAENKKVVYEDKPLKY